MSLIYLILGMLNDEAASGYDLNKEFQSSINHFWTTDQSQIYRTLHKLKDRGWVELEHIVQHENPDKKIYHITEAGEAALLEWLRHPLTLSEEPVREGWLGQLFFGQNLTDAELLHILKSYLQREEVAVAELKALLQATRKQIPPQAINSRITQIRLLTLDFGIEIRQSYADWLKKAIQSIENLDET